MKKALFSIMLFASFLTKAQTATNFNCNDCQGNNHDFFTELNSGKVIVLCWVMPCSTCISPAQTANNIVNSYSVSNPGQVLFYLCDDFGTTSCNTLNNWATSNGLTNYTAFSDNSIKMSDYGSNGMPKIVVAGGGTAHLVYDNQNNTLNASTFSTAINNALAASPTGIAELGTGIFSSEISPNPANAELSLSFQTQSAENCSIEIFNIAGQKVKSMLLAAEAGNNRIKIDTRELASGVYTIRISNGKRTETNKAIIQH